MDTILTLIGTCFGSMITGAFALRTQLNIQPNKFGSVKVELFEKNNNDEKRLNYKLSDYKYLKHFFEESPSIFENDKIEIKELDRLNKEGKK